MKKTLFLALVTILCIPFVSSASTHIPCSPGDLFSTETGLPCHATVHLPCQTGDKYSILTGKLCNSQSVSRITTTIPNKNYPMENTQIAGSAESQITVSIAPMPINPSDSTLLVNPAEGAQGAPLLGFIVSSQTEGTITGITVNIQASDALPETLTLSTRSLGGNSPISSLAAASTNSFPVTVPIQANSSVIFTVSGNFLSSITPGSTVIASVTGVTFTDASGQTQTTTNITGGIITLNYLPQ